MTLSSFNKHSNLALKPNTMSMDKSRIRTLLFCFLFFFTTSLSKHLCHQEDKNTLLKIQKSLNNPYALSTWDPQTDCCSSWSGVQCSDTVNYRVSGLFISDDEVSGQIPPEVGDLTYLENLVFQNLPNLTGKIPPTIAKLKNLVSLWIISTSVNGPVPQFLGDLKNLQFLDLSSNNLSGSIPYSLGLLPKCLSLNLSNNKLSGWIPSTLPPKVAYIDLSHNQLSGTTPLSLGTLDFYSIDLSWNKLEGDAFVLFEAKKKTGTINISRNMFHFKLSKRELPRTLKELDMSHNRIYGHIPANWTEAPLQVLNVSYNKLCGRIPTGGKFQTFDSSSYSHNKCLCGAPLPACK